MTPLSPLPLRIPASLFTFYYGPACLVAYWLRVQRHRKPAVTSGCQCVVVHSARAVPRSLVFFVFVVAYVVFRDSLIVVILLYATGIVNVTVRYWYRECKIWLSSISNARTVTPWEPKRY